MNKVKNMQFTKKEICSKYKPLDCIFTSDNTQCGVGLGKFYTQPMLEGKQFGEQIVSMY